MAKVVFLSQEIKERRKKEPISRWRKALGLPFFGASGVLLGVLVIFSILLSSVAQALFSIGLRISKEKPFSFELKIAVPQEYVGTEGTEGTKETEGN